MGSKRDNQYWAGRMLKDGHTEILERCECGEISMYRARQLAGYLSAKPSTPSERLSYHWERADTLQREKFVLDNREAIARTIADIQKRAEKVKAQKPSE